MKKNLSFHHFPSDPKRRASWLEAFGLEASEIRFQSQVCCRHFCDGDATSDPIASLRKRFASPIKGKHSRARRARNREVVRQLTELKESLSPLLSVKSTSASPVATDICSCSCTTDETFSETLDSEMFGEADSEYRNETDGIIAKGVTEGNRNEDDIRNKAEDACGTIRIEGETTNEGETTSKAESEAMSTGTQVTYSSGKQYES